MQHQLKSRYSSLSTMSTTTSILQQSRWLRVFVPLLALFVSLGAASQVQAQNTITSASITLTTGTSVGTSSTATYDAQNNTNTGATYFNNQNFGSFDVSNGVFTINAGTFSINETGNPYTSGELQFYIYQASSTPGTVGVIPLTDQGTVNGVHTYSFTGGSFNVLSFVSAAGAGTAYKFTIVYEASSPVLTQAAPRIIDTNVLTATFTATGTPPTTNIWTGAISDDWFVAGNWSAGTVPDGNTDVTVPNFSSGNAAKYPNVYAAGTTVIGTGASTVTYNTGNVVGAAVRNLTLVGNNSTTDRSIMRLQNGTLTINGDFNNQYLSFIARDNTTVNFAGSNPQAIDGGSFASVLVSGTGQKNINGPLLVNEAFTFANNSNFLVVTDSQRPSTSYIQLADRNAVNNFNGAQLVNETNTAYILGLIQTSRAGVQALEMETVNGVTGPSPRTFGGIGFTAYFTTNSLGNAPDPGDITITRSTVSNYFTTANPYTYNKYGVKRIFGVRPSFVPTASSGPLQANVTFTVLPRDLTNLAPNNGSIAPQDIALAVSSNNGNTFTYLGRDGAPTTNNPTSYTVAKSGVTTFATFTLTDVNNPLPVKLVAFEAKRSSENVLVTWATASETNNSGFEVQVSTDGLAFHKLAWINSANANSLQRQSYGYTDTENGKSGLRYYRLRQVDLDGKEVYSGVKVVSFDTFANSTEAAIAVYPNPFTRDEQATLTIQSPVAGSASLQIMDMTGRNVSTSSISTVTGVNEIAISTISNLNKGIYLVKVTFASGEAKTVRMQKQ